jgi:hypothetical protein
VRELHNKPRLDKTSKAVAALVIVWSFAPVCKIIKQRRAIRLRPDSASDGEAVISGLDYLLAVEDNSEPMALELDTQSLPDAGGDFGVDVLEGDALPLMVWQIVTLSSKALVRAMYEREAEGEPRGVPLADPEAY